MANNNGSNGLLFLLNPFLSAINSLINIRDKQSQKLLYLWFLVFGAAFCAVNETADAYRWVEIFNIESKYTVGQYLDQIRLYFSFDSDIKDIYALTVNFIVGRFTDNYHWTYLIYASVFGYFYIKSLQIFFRYEIVDNVFFYSLLFLFCYSNPILNICGMRMWTASWMAVYATLKIIIDKDYRCLFLLFLTPLVHDSFFIWIAIVLIAIITWRAKKIWYILFIASSFVSAVSFLDLFSAYTDFLPQFMQNQVWAYTESENALDKMAGVTTLPLYAQILRALPGYFILALSYILIFKTKQIDSDSDKARFLYLFIVIATITNFISPIPSLNRFSSVTIIPFLVIVWAMNKDVLINFKKFLMLAPVAYSYSILYWLRELISETEIWLYICPAPVTFIKYLFFP